MNKIDKIFQILKKLYPDPKTELDYSTPFQLMVAVILSAQTTDKQVNKITPAIFRSVKKPIDLLQNYKNEKAFEKAVSGVNYYKTKAKNIWKLAQILLDKSSPLWLTNPYPKGSSSPNPPSFGHLLSQGGQKGTQKIEGQIEELMKLPGIGIKSAKVIGHVLRDLPVIAVDTHVHRVVNRWGITNPSQPSLSQGKAKAWSPGTKTPEETSEILEKIVPKKYKDFAHHAIVLFGRYVCTAKKPKCEDCKLKRYCDYYFNL